MSSDASKTAEDAWKQTVRAIFDELHFGRDSVFCGQSRAARKIVGMIEERHRDYFCEGRTLGEWGQLKAEEPK